MTGWREVWQFDFLGNPLGAWTLALATFLVTFTVLPAVTGFISARRRRLIHGPPRVHFAIDLTALLIERTSRLFLWAVAVWLGSRPPPFAPPPGALADRRAGAAVLDAGGAVGHGGRALRHRRAPPALQRAGHAAQELDGSDPVRGRDGDLGTRAAAGAGQSRREDRAAAGRARHRRHRTRARRADRAGGSARLALHCARQGLRARGLPGGRRLAGHRRAHRREEHAPAQPLRRADHHPARRTAQGGP